MTDRRGERAGWTWGWIGGFLWVAVIALFFLAQGRLVAGGGGLLLFALAVWSTRHFAPWRHPTTPYWRLMAVGYVLLLLCAVWAVGAFGGFAGRGVDGWMLLWLVPMVIPVFTNGRRTWADSATDVTRRS